MHFKQTKDEKGLSLNQKIEFGCICIEKRFPRYWKSNLMPKEYNLFRFLKGRNAYKVNL
jgi:hypothetical protein